MKTSKKIRLLKKLYETVYSIADRRNTIESSIADEIEAKLIADIESKKKIIREIKPRLLKKIRRLVR